MAAEKTGAVRCEAFLAFLESAHKERAFPAIAEADAWVARFLATIRVGMGAEPPAPEFSLSEGQLARAANTFGAVAALQLREEDVPDSALLRVGKEGLVLAMGGDFGLFEEMDVDMSGEVDEAQWQSYMQRTYCGKCAKRGKSSSGDKWFDRLIGTLERGCGSVALTEAQIEQVPCACLASPSGPLSPWSLVGEIRLWARGESECESCGARQPHRQGGVSPCTRRRLSTL